MGKNLDTETVKSGNAVKSDEEWRKTLTPEEFRVTRQHGTERAFSHPYAQEKRDGMYRCVCCGAPLFNSETKFDSGTGWPSFYGPADGGSVSEHEDHSLFTHRTELRQMRSPSWACLSRRSQPHRIALLHQRRRFEAR